MNNVPIARVLGPLPQNAFIVSARDSIPEARQRVTTATTRGNLMGRGGGRSTATRAQTRSAPTAQQQSNARGRGRGQNLSKKKRDVVATTSGNVQDGPAVVSRITSNTRSTTTTIGTANRNRAYNTGLGVLFTFYLVMISSQEQVRYQISILKPSLISTCMILVSARMPHKLVKMMYSSCCYFLSNFLMMLSKVWFPY